MKLSTKKILVASLLLAGAFKVLAMDDKVMCPSVNSVKQSWLLLDTVTKATPPKFVVWTTGASMQDESHRSWSIVTYVDADNMDAAFAAGQNSVKNITESKFKYAQDLRKIYFCNYKSVNSTLGVGLISYKNDDNHDFKFTSINLDRLK